MTTKADSNTVIPILALCHFSGVQPRLLEVLIRHYGSIDRILRADAGSLMAIPGMTTELANSVADAKSHLSRADDYYGQLHQRDISVVSRFDDDYPDRLFELNDPPALLYFRGSLPDKASKLVALAGGQKASNEGIELTVEVARRFADAGVRVIASLSRGVDAAAHLGSKSGNGNSYAVLNSGLDNLYPEDGRPLAIDIVKEGGLLSEYPPESQFQPDNFKSSQTRCL